MSLLQDLKFALRGLLKRPGFLTTVLFTLGVSQGAVTAVFTIVHSVLLSPLPYTSVDRLVVIWNQKILQDLPRLQVSAPEFLDYGQSKAFEHLAAYYPWDYTLKGSQEPLRVRGAVTTASLFPTLGVKAALGRTFSSEEDQSGREKVAVVSYGFWQRHFGRDPGALGKTLNLDGEPYEVIGVMPPDYAYPQRETDVWVPLAIDPQDLPSRKARRLQVVGRLAPGVTPEIAQAEMSTVAAQMQKAYPDIYPVESGWGVLVVPLVEEIVGPVRPGLLLLSGAVVLVLLIACANIANLLLVRATARQKEIAVRIALGSSPRRLVRQLLTESVALALLGGLLGLLLGHWATRALVVLAANNIPRFDEVQMDPVVFAVALLAALVTGLLFGIAPAALSARPELAGYLKDGSKGGSMGGGRGRLRGALVVVEVALALVLLIGAGLMVKSFVRLQQVDPGFRPQNVLVAALSLPYEKYPEQSDFQGFYDRFLSELGSLPQVESAAAVAVAPFSDELVWSGDMTPEGRLEGGKSESKVETFLATPGYARAIGLHLLQGRFVSAQDIEETPLVVVVDDVLARRYWPNESALGKQIKSGGVDSDSPWMKVVGVVRHIKREALDVESLPQIYVPLAQASFRWPGRVDVVVRTSSDPQALIPSVRSKLRELDPEQPLSSIAPMEQIIADSISRPRFLAWLLTAFAIVALAVTGVGLYSVIAYWVSLRVPEIGLRMALGARRGDVFQLVLGQGLGLTLFGLVVGVVTAFWATQAMQSVLFEVSAADPLIFIAAPLLLVLIAAFACQLPAWRAARLDPGRILRQD